MQKLNCVLLIDDDWVTNYLHQLIITDLNIAHQIHCCSNGQEALVFLEQCIHKELFPELILVDRRMPQMDGFEFLEAYMENGYHQKHTTVVAMVTIHMNAADLARLQKLGFVEYVERPLKEDNILGLAEGYYNRRNQASNIV